MILIFVKAKSSLPCNYYSVMYILVLCVVLVGLIAARETELMTNKSKCDFSKENNSWLVSLCLHFLIWYFLLCDLCYHYLLSNWTDYYNYLTNECHITERFITTCTSSKFRHQCAANKTNVEVLSAVQQS